MFILPIGPKRWASTAGCGYKRQTPETTRHQSFSPPENPFASKRSPTTIMARGKQLQPSASWFHASSEAKGSSRLTTTVFCPGWRNVCVLAVCLAAGAQMATAGGEPSCYPPCPEWSQQPFHAKSQSCCAPDFSRVAACLLVLQAAVTGPTRPIWACILVVICQRGRHPSSAIA